MDKPFNTPHLGAKPPAKPHLVGNLHISSFPCLPKKTRNLSSKWGRKIPEGSPTLGGPCPHYCRDNSITLLRWHQRNMKKWTRCHQVGVALTSFRPWIVGKKYPIAAPARQVQRKTGGDFYGGKIQVRRFHHLKSSRWNQERKIRVRFGKVRWMLWWNNKALIKVRNIALMDK